MKRVTLLALLIGIAGSASAQTSPLTLVDHFRCYPFSPPQPSNQITVGLKDQFQPMSLFTQTITRTEFCNPVQKTVNGVVTPILNANHHFVMYAVAIPTPGYDATISNQFGTQDLVIAGPMIMAVPAGEGQPPSLPSADLDHYECYSATTRELFNTIQVKLQDAFTTETVTVLSVAFFCNPTVKTHNGTTIIQHLATHLTCYATSRSSYPGRTVDAQDQFFAVHMLVQSPDMLCVPTLKLSWQQNIPE